MPSVYTNGLQPHQIDDLVNNTLHLFEKDSWIDIATELQHYFAYEDLLLQNRIAVAGGDMLQWQVKVRNTNSARNTGMFARDSVSVQDITKHAKIWWTKQTCNFAYDIDESEFNDPEPVRILNLLRARRHDALTSLAELMESNLWGLPTDINNEDEMLKPLGIPYWIVRNATKGFNGGVPVGSNFTDVGGLSPSTYPRWQNFTGQYVVMDKHDLVRLMREGTVKCRFKQPVSHPAPNRGRPRYRIATVYEVIARLEEILETQNDNNGNDVAKYDGELHFRRVPVTWVPFLDNHMDPLGTDTDNPLGKNPVYGIDLDAFHMVFKRGAMMRRTRPLIAPEQHTVRHVHYDSWMNFRCFNRRSNWVFTQAA